MDRISKDDALDVPDSTDWLETPLRSLADVDSALRCQVCRDFYTTPMITSCSHTFCSLCIRRSLNNDGKCPACRAPEQEMKLRNNNAVEDLVDAFKRARSDTLAFARKPATATANLPRKRSLEPTEGEMEDSSPIKRRRSERTRPSSQRVITAEDSDDDYIPDNGLVSCPICERKVKEANINKHIDNGCPDELQTARVTKALGSRPGRGSDKTPISTESVTKKFDRLPQLNYSTIRDNVLKKKLTDAGLSAAGNRLLLEKRYTEWITLWNANCDATKPKSKADLKKELDAWERTQGGRATASSATQMGAQIRDKDFDGKAWSRKHDSDFQALIAKANQQKQNKTPSSVPTSTGSAETTTLDARPVADMDAIMWGNGPSEAVIIRGTPEKHTSHPVIDENALEPPPSSQYRDKLDTLEYLDRDAGMASDITTIEPVQP